MKFIKPTTYYLNNIKLVLTILIVGLQISSSAQNNNETAQLSLDGTWDIIFDDDNKGIEQDWFLDEIYDKQEFKQITVPSCWEEIEKNYEGAGIYRTKFTIPENWNDKIIELNFEAVNYKSEVWINDQVVGFHEGGYTPFGFRVDKLIKVGEENTLVVRVISPIILTDKYIDGLGRQEVPMWRGAITGGIWQSVSIEAKGTLGLKDVFIEPKIDTNTAVFNIEIENTETTVENTEVSVKIFSNDGKEVVTKTETLKSFPGKNTIQWNLAIENAEYWSTKNPYLYKAE